MSQLTQIVDTDDHVEGPETAAVTLVEYGDYQCPYCGEAYPVLKEVVREMGNKVRFVFRNFPITEIHPNALAAAQFAEAAATIGKFWEAHDLLYEHQDALSHEDLFAYARTIALPEHVLRHAFEGALNGKISRDFNHGVRSGVNGTPALFINGMRYDGPRDALSLVEELSSLIPS